MTPIASHLITTVPSIILLIMSFLWDKHLKGKEVIAVPSCVKPREDIKIIELEVIG